MADGELRHLRNKIFLYIFGSAGVGSIGAQVVKNLKIYVFVAICAVGVFGSAVATMAGGASP
jgi:hypothetical protein